MGTCQTHLGCFCAGTLVRTPQGDVPVESLQAGALVSTMDGGAQPIVWRSKRVVTPAQQAADSSLRPVQIATDALGDGMPAQPLMIAPHQQLFVRSEVRHRLFAATDMLYPASHYIGEPGITQAAMDVDVTYYHFVISGQHVIWANGVPCESTPAQPMADKHPAHVDRIWGTSVFQRHDVNRRPPLKLIVTPADPPPADV